MSKDIGQGLFLSYCEISGEQMHNGPKMNRKKKSNGYWQLRHHNIEFQGRNKFSCLKNVWIYNLCSALKKKLSKICSCMHQLLELDKHQTWQMLVAVADPWTLRYRSLLHLGYVSAKLLWVDSPHCWWLIHWHWL